MMLFTQKLGVRVSPGFFSFKDAVKDTPETLCTAANPPHTPKIKKLPFGAAL